MMQRRLRRLWGGVVGGVLLIAAAAAVAWFVRPVPVKVRIQADARRLSAVGMVARLYAEDHGGAYPDTFATALHGEDQLAQFAFCALASNSSEPDPRYPYVYLGHEMTADAVGNKTVIAYSPLAFTDGLGANVLFGDSNVVWVTAADLPAVLARGGPATRPATPP